jgi:hypothetical protein
VRVCVGVCQLQVSDGRQEYLRKHGNA